MHKKKKEPADPTSSQLNPPDSPFIEHKNTTLIEDDSEDSASEQEKQQDMEEDIPDQKNIIEVLYSIS